MMTFYINTLHVFNWSTLMSTHFNNIFTMACLQKVQG